jgi:hypothetical protein
MQFKNSENLAYRENSDYADTVAYLLFAAHGEIIFA